MSPAIPRAVFASIQRAHPTAFARAASATIAGAIEIADGADLVSALAGKPRPTGLRVGGASICLADSAEALAGAETVAAGQLRGQVVIVSGAASGLGLGVAMGMHAAGAAVVFTDIDRAGLEAIDARLAGDSRVLTVAVDVTDEASVASAFDAAIQRFGRIDAVACCAGIAPAFELDQFPLDKWRLALDVNLTGYFLFGREAARVMRAQGHGGSMILLSSKSGLEPSKANTAYNATKAGEIHMARGWALELGRDGIRVNCIAPGNVFEGSKIWNTDYIATVAKKRGIQPDQVIPHYVGMTALNRDIKPGDIANAAVFLSSDAARCVTGQVLVVDSGQVWTR